MRAYQFLERAHHPLLAQCLVRDSLGKSSCVSISSHTLNAVLNLSIKLLQSLNVLLTRFPVASSIRLQECRDHVSKCIGICVKETLLHFWVINEHAVCILKDKVVHLSSSGRPPHGISQALLNLTHSFISSGEHTFIELGVE